MVDSALEVAYGIGGRCVTCPFSHSASFSSLDVGVELIINNQQDVLIERCFQDQALERAFCWTLEKPACGTHEQIRDL